MSNWIGPHGKLWDFIEGKISNLWFNIRFGTYHWQWGRDGMTFKQNAAQVAWREKEPETWKWFAIYFIFGIYL